MVHFDADNDISKESRNVVATILGEDESVKKTHLDIAQMMDSFDRKGCPRFKEMAFMTSKTISFVECLDKILLDEVDVLTALDDILSSELKRNQQIFDGIFSTVGDKRRQKIIQFIKNCGFVEIEDSSKDVNMFIDFISNISYKEAKDKLLSGTLKK